MLGLDDVAEPDRHDGRVASRGAGVDAMAGDRIERGRNSSRPCAPGSRSSRSRARPLAGADGRGSRCGTAWKPTIGKLPPMREQQHARAVACRASGSSFSARARISVPRNDPELWPTSTISSASLSRATLTRCCAKRSMRSSHSGRCAVRELPGPDRVRTGDRARRCGSRCISARCRARAKKIAIAAATLKRSGTPIASRPFCEARRRGSDAERLHQQHDMRVGDEGRETASSPA